MAVFLVLLQIAIVYGAIGPLQSSSTSSSPSIGSPKVLKVGQCCIQVFLAPIAASSNNVYISWWTNKTGDLEIMFRASADNGQTFGPKINLSNSPRVDSVDASIAASENNVYVSWRERTNQTSNDPVMRVSNDNGQTFGPILKLASNGTIGATQ